MLFILAVIFFCFGLIIGSFLNVVIYRLNTERSFGGRSACMSCRRQLRSHELIPVLSFLILRGRCRSCETSISLQYPVVELLTGLVSVAAFYKLRFLFSEPPLFFLGYAYYFLLFSLLIVIVVYDIKHKIIPDTFSFTFSGLAFLGLFFVQPGFSQFSLHLPSILELLPGILIAAPFYLLWRISRGRWMGLGDAKLALGIGWLLGLASALSALVVSFWIGTFVGIGMVLFGQKFGKTYSMKSEIPFAPYLVLGALLAFLFELNLFQIYL